MAVLIGLDVGLTAASAVAIDDAGRIVASASAEYSIATPRPGWAEQEPVHWWLASREVLGRVVADVGSGISSIGLTGQMHGAVFLDDRGEPVRPALLWTDTRTALQCDRMTERIGGERLIEITGNPPLTTFLAPKVLWLRDVEPVQFRHVKHVLLPKDYVRLMLTGEVATDVTDASGTLLFDLRRRDWSGQILAALEIPRDWLPVVHESSDIPAQISPAAASELGMAPGVPIAAGAGEHASAALATGIVSEDVASSSLDSRGLVVAQRQELAIDRAGRLHTFCDCVPARYQLLGITPSAGTSLRWWRDLLGGRNTDDELVKLAESVPPGGDGLIFLPSLAGDGAYRPDTNPRGAFVGLRAHHTPAHLTRAVMEGIVFGLRNSLDAMRGQGARVHTIRATGIGGRRGFWRRLQADIFNLPVQHTLGDESPAYGAALLAGVAAGVFRDFDEAAAHVRVSDSINHPDPNRARAYEAVYGTFRQLYPALHTAATRAG